MRASLPGSHHKSLRVVTLLVLLASFTALALGQWGMTRWRYTAGFDEAERSDAIARTQRAHDIVLDRAKAMMNHVSDNGAWDDAYNFMLGQDPGFPERQFVEESHRRLALDGYAFVGSAHRADWVRQYSPARKAYVEADPAMQQALQPGGTIGAQIATGDASLGFDWIDGKLYAWGAAPTRHSDGSGPYLGYQVLLSRLDEDFLRATSQAVGGTVEIRPIPRAPARGPPDSRERLGVVFATNPDGTLTTSMPLASPNGAVSLAIFVSEPRVIHGLAMRAFHSVLLTTICFGAFVSALALWFIDRRIIGPIERASASLVRIGQMGDLSQRVPLPPAQDAIGALVQATNQMLEELERNQEAEAARDAAVRASRLKSQFLARMSHEIRTPMNGVLGMTELLRATPLDMRQSRYAKIIHQSAESLLGVINDVLDFSKIEAGKLEIVSAPLDLRAVLEDAVDLFAEQAAAKGLALTCDIAPGLHTAVRGDELRLRQILVNLIGNALKFTDQGAIRVTARELARTETKIQLQVSVHDTGVGIKPENLELIFESFAQVDESTTRRYGGTGLGLTISRQLVELMGGTLGVVSTPGSGSTFQFTVTFACEPQLKLTAA